MKKTERTSWISLIGIFNGFKCMTDIDILNKTKHKNNSTKWKHGICKGKLFRLPLTL